MTTHPTLTTGRLLLRPWRPSDLPAFAALNADPRVTEFLPGVLDRAESDAVAARIAEHFERHGFGLWAVEVVGGRASAATDFGSADRNAGGPAAADFIGFVGLAVPRFEAHFTPCVEIGWRLAHGHWGKGYASEAARAAVEFAFGPLALDQIVSMTVPANVRSRAVMERLGMTRDEADDFDHPLLPAGHPLSRHVLYRLARPKEVSGADPADEPGANRD